MILLIMRPRNKLNEMVDHGILLGECPCAAIGVFLYHSNGSKKDFVAKHLGCHSTLALWFSARS